MLRRSTATQKIPSYLSSSFIFLPMINFNQIAQKSTKSSTNNNNDEADADDNNISTSPSSFIKTTAMMTELQLPKSRRPDLYRMLREEGEDDDEDEDEKNIRNEMIDQIDEKAPVYIVSFHKEEAKQQRKK